MKTKGTADSSKSKSGRSTKARRQEAKKGYVIDNKQAWSCQRPHNGSMKVATDI